MKRFFCLLALVLVTFPFSSALAASRMPAISCDGSGCWDQENWGSYSVAAIAVQLTAQGSSLENITNGGDMGAVMFEQMTDPSGYFIQV